MSPARKKLTEAQREVLKAMGSTPSLRQSDENTPEWWIEGGGAVYKRTALALVRLGFIEFCVKWGGHPGILGYRVTPSGRSVLEGDRQ